MSIRLCECGCGGELQPNARGKYARFIRNHDKRLSGPDYYVDENGCWIWLRGINPNGYGSACYQGKTILAHRLYWITYNGPIPDGLDVLHKCDVMRCVNPEHFFLGTQADNIADKVSKNRQARGVSHGRHTRPERTARGSRSGTSKLTEEAVVSIHGRYSNGGVTQRELAEEHGVDRSTISAALRGRNWRGVA